MCPTYTFAYINIFWLFNPADCLNSIDWLTEKPINEISDFILFYLFSVLMLLIVNVFINLGIC